MPSIYFEDLEPGRTTTFGRKRVTEEEIVAFAKAYDAQPFHLSEEAAKGTFVGRLIASGWHTIAMQMRMLCDAWILDAAGLGSPGVEELHWLKPVLPGDVLEVRQTILGAQPSRSRPGMGVVRFRFETLNESGDVVMRQVNPIMFTRREAAEPEARAGADKRHTVTVQDEFGALRPSSGGIPQVLRPFEELEVGATDFLGEHVFEAEDIVSFARSFDPQPFHLSDDAARRGPFGRLAASGWQTAAIWMRHLVVHRVDAVTRARADGLVPPVFGPSPGFRDLRWLRPVLAGDTIRFATTLVDRRESASRPGWGLVFNHNTGWNQHGAKAFEFSGSAFVRMG